VLNEKVSLSSFHPKKKMIFVLQVLTCYELSSSILSCCEC
jgi:hypothetical protein